MQVKFPFEGIQNINKNIKNVYALHLDLNTYYLDSVKVNNFYLKLIKLHKKYFLQAHQKSK